MRFFTGLLVVVCLCSFVWQSSTAMAGTTYALEPASFAALPLDRSTEEAMRSSRSTRDNELTPPRPEGAYGIWITMPRTVKGYTDNLTALVWEDIKIPLCLRYMLEGLQLRSLCEQYVYLKDIRTGREITFWADVNSYDLLPPCTPSVVEDTFAAGATHTCNITFFTDLPKYSATYEIWVRIGAVESNHVRVALQLYENGRLVPHPEK